MNLFTSLLLLLTSLTVQAEYDINACVSAKKSFYQCIDEFVKESLPDTNWCTIAPIDRNDKSQGFFIITVKMSSDKNNFEQQAHFLKAGTSGKLVSKASGTWKLDGRTVRIKYSGAVTSVSNIKFPTNIQIDFKDLTGNKLVIYNAKDEQFPKFGPIVFQKCTQLTFSN